MHFRYGFLLLLGVQAWATAAHGQVEPDSLLEQLLESTADERAEDTDYAELVERLAYYRRHPIDLNRTDGTELQELVFVPLAFIDRLLEHRERSGAFVSVLELQALAGADPVLLRLLWPYVTVHPKSSVPKWTERGDLFKSRALQRKPMWLTRKGPEITHLESDFPCNRYRHPIWTRYWLDCHQDKRPQALCH